MRTRVIVLQLIILLFAIAALYGHFLSSPFVFDDKPFFVDDGRGNQPAFGYQFSLFELRSLPYATFAWSKSVFGQDILHFRIENLLLHTAAVFSLYFFLKRLFDTVLGVRAVTLLSSSTLAFCAALLFALHPVAVYAAGYLIQRTIVMATLFSLLAMLAYLHGSVREKPLWLWASVLFYYLAVFSKEHAIMLPAVLLALTVLVHDDWHKKLKQRWPVFLAFAAIALFVVAAKRGMLGSVYEVYAPDMLGTEGSQSYLMSVLTQSWLFFKYLGLWLFPNPRWMSVDMREPFAQALLSPYLVALMVFFAWGAGATWLLLKRGRTGLLGLAMLFPWLMFMTEFTTVRIQESFVLYRSYLWAAGACCLLPVLLDFLDRRIASVVVAAAALAMVPASMDRLASFSHSLILWDDAEKLVRDRQDLPGVYRIYYNRGTELIRLGDYDKAIRDLALSIKLYPDWPFSHNNLGAAYARKWEWRAAVGEYTQAILIAERKKMGVNPMPYYGRAMALEALGEVGQAKLDYQISCRLAKKGCDKI